MKKLYISLLTLFITLVSVQLTSAQLIEDFNSGEKRSYAPGSVELSSGTWFMKEALLGNLANDKYNGAQGVRMQVHKDTNERGVIYMLFDKPDGAQDLTFSMANYGTSGGNT